MDEHAVWPSIYQMVAICKDKMLAMEGLHKDHGTLPPCLYEAWYLLSLLARNPVYLFSMDKDCITQPPHGYEIKRWEDLLNHIDKENCPKVVTEI